jgi:tetratricopeptide (TPR) repeat protein
MELVKGTPITKYCDDHKLTPKDRLGLFVQVCQAVQHAHQKGVIHRDLKPSNVLVAPYDGKPVVKVIDFGVAKAAGQPLTEKTLVTGLGAVVGTPEYMSPEQAELNNADIDTRSDIYALGVLLYELLTGTTPLTKLRVRQAALLEVLRVIREEEPPRPSTRLSTNAELPSIAAVRGLEPARLSKLVRGELDWIVMKALEKDRARRYETANGFAQDIERYLADEPVLACPPSAGYRLRKFARRNKGSITLASVVLLFLIVLGSGIGWAVRDRAARDAAAAKERQDREEALDREVGHILDEAEALAGRGKWPEALAAVERADKLLESAGRAERPPQLLGWQRDLTMARRVADIYREPQAPQQSSRPRNSAEEYYSEQRQDARFGTAFQEFGIDVDALPPGECAARIGRARIREALVRALDEWAALRKQARGGDDPGWRTLVEVARQADSDDWRNRFREALLRLDRPALEKLAAAVPLRDVPPATLHLLGSALKDVGALQKAVDVLRQAQQQYPDDPWINDTLALFSLNEFYPPRLDDAVRFYTVAAALRPRSPHAHRALAVALDNKEAFADAMAEYSRVIELTPEDARAWYERGEFCRMALQQDDKAMADYAKAVEVDPNNFLAHLSLGGQLMKKGQVHEAIVEFMAVIRLTKDKPDFGLRQALYSLRQKGQLKEIMARFQEDARLKPDDATAYIVLAIALEVDAQPGAAIDEYREALRLLKKDAGAHVKLCNALVNAGRLDEAALEYRRAVLLYPDRAWVHLGLGANLNKNGQRMKAVAALGRGLAAVPMCGGSHISSSWAIAALGGEMAAVASPPDANDQLKEAVDEYRKGIRLGFDAPGLHVSFGNLLLDNGQLGEAIGQYPEAHRFATAHLLGTGLSQAGYAGANMVLNQIQSLDTMRRAIIRHSDVLGGKDQPRDAAECLLFAQLSRMRFRQHYFVVKLDEEFKPLDLFSPMRFRQEYASAVRLFSEAFTRDPALAEDLEVASRYSAACTAAVIATQPTQVRAGTDLVKLRRQALDWLRADLDARSRLADQAPIWVAGSMQLWQRDPDLEGVRNPTELARLPEPERKAWEKLWEDVVSTLSRAQTKAKWGKTFPEK